LDYKIFDNNTEVAFEQAESTPIFNRLEWFSLFEYFICNDNFFAQTMFFSNQSKQFILPLASSGEHLSSLTNYYNPFFKLLGSVEASTEDYMDIVQSGQHFFKKHPVIDLLPLYSQDVENWKKAFENIGFKAFTYQHTVNWYHDNISDLDQYWALRPSKLRNTLKRKKAKLEKSGEYSLIMAEPGDVLELNHYLAEYHHVYYDSWKKAEPYPAFIDAIAKYAWKQGELRLGLVYHKNIPVAAQIWFVNTKTAYIYKLAYRCDYTKASVGTVLTGAMIEHVIEQDKVNCIDYLTGDDAYKQDWMQSKRPLMGIQLCNVSTMAGKKAYFRNTLSSIRKQIGFE